MPTFAISASAFAISASAFAITSAAIAITSAAIAITSTTIAITSAAIAITSAAIAISFTTAEPATCSRTTPATATLTATSRTVRHSRTGRSDRRDPFFLSLERLVAVFGSARTATFALEALPWAWLRGELQTHIIRD